MTADTARLATAARTPVRVGMTAFRGLLLRDLRVVTREPVRFLLRTLSQPLLLVFVFTYVFPSIGQGFTGPQDDSSYASILVPGVLAIAVLIKGIQAVALPLVTDFGYTREIEDRVMAPLPVWAVGMEKIVAGALEAVVAAFLVVPIALFVPAEPAELMVSWPALIAVGLLAPLVASSLGLVIGTFVAPSQVPLMFSVVIIPITFLGATYFPWAALDAIPWLQVVTLANPLVYMAEGFRMALTPQFPHMPAPAILGALLGFTIVTGWLGLKGFRRRVLD